MKNVSQVVSAQRKYREGDYSGAFILFKECADHGDTFCQTELGWMLCSGEGHAVDCDLALEYFSKAAAVGDEEAKFGIGRIYLLKRDYKNAWKWFSAASADGFAPGHFRCGWMMHYGFGNNVDLDEAYRFYLLGHACGHFNSTRGLAILLLKGYKGFLGFLSGIKIMSCVLLRVLSAVIKNPKDPRFLI